MISFERTSRTAARSGHPRYFGRTARACGQNGRATPLALPIAPIETCPSSYPRIHPVVDTPSPFETQNLGLAWSSLRLVRCVGCAWFARSHEPRHLDETDATRDRFSHFSGSRYGKPVVIRRLAARSEPAASTKVRLGSNVYTAEEQHIPTQKKNNKKQKQGQKTKTRRRARTRGSCLRRTLIRDTARSPPYAIDRSLVGTLGGHVRDQLAHSAGTHVVRRYSEGNSSQDPSRR